MRRAMLALVLPTLAVACAQTEQYTLAKLAGPTNIAAMDAAAACDNDEALGLTRTEMASTNAPRRLMANYTQAAILMDMGRSSEASQLLATAAADPGLNPDGKSASQFAEPVQPLQQAIQDKRQDLLGSRTC